MSLLSSEKTMKLSDYFKINKPEYVYLKLVSNTSVRNTKANDLAKTINGCYEKFFDRFKREHKGFSYNIPSKVCFIVEITKDNAEFFMMVPKIALKDFKQKLTEVFGKIEIGKIDPIKISEDCTRCSLGYTKNDVFSLASNKNSNNLLAANLSVMELLQSDDKVTIIYNFMPASQQRISNWKHYYKDMIDKYNAGVCMDKKNGPNKLKTIVLNFLFSTLDTLIHEVQNMFMDNRKKKKEEYFSNMLPQREPSYATTEKAKDVIIDAQIVLCSESVDLKREKENMRALIGSFKSIDGDNELRPAYINKRKEPKATGPKRNKFKNVNKEVAVSCDNKKEEKYIELESYEFEKSQVMTISSAESSNFTSLPGLELINEHKIECAESTETIVPEELKNGNVRLGESRYRGKTCMTTISSDEDAACLPIIIMAKSGGGKTTLFENMGVDSVKNGESLIVIDYIKNCEMSDNIIKNIPKDKVVVVDFTDYMNIPGFGFNEILHLLDPNDPMSVYVCASLQKVQICTLVDNLNLNHEKLSASMETILDAACTAVLIHPNKALKDVTSCLLNYKIRAEYVEKLIEFTKTMPERYRGIMLEKVDILKELDDVDSKSKNKKIENKDVIGTKYGKIEGIITRINKLKKNHLLEFMYANTPEGNIDLVECMQSGKAVFFKLPQFEVSTPEIKNVIVTYLMSKITVASEVRAKVYANEKLRITNVIFDEIQQAPGCYNNVDSMAYQMRKFRTRLTFSTHGFHKIDSIKDTLIEAGASIMLLKGSSTKNYDVMQDEFKAFGFDRQALVSLSLSEEYKALSLIATKKGRYGVITKLPPPVKNKIEIETYTEAIKEEDAEEFDIMLV